MVVGGNKNAYNRPIGADGKRGWSFGLFGCFSRCSLCTYQNWSTRVTFHILTNFSLPPLSTAGCCAWCCPCVVYSKNRQRLRNLQQQGAPLPDGGKRYDDHCCIYAALVPSGYAWVLQVRLRCLKRCRVTDTSLSSPVDEIPNRAETRERYGIRGDAYTDCFVAWLCRPCSLTQERREIELEESSLGI
jgi:Cys-rich protein (TIGR01571 family)